MTVLHSGSNKKFAAGWEAVFTGGHKSGSATKAKTNVVAAKRTKAKKSKGTARAGKKAK